MSDPSTIRVLLADDQRVVREGLAMLLGLLPRVEIVGSAADGDQAVVLARQLRPDVVLMDLRMPRMDGIEATKQLHEEDPGIRVIALTTYADDRSVMEALRAGARGYLTKDAGGEDIQRALEETVAGHSVIDPAVQHHLIEAVTAGPASASPRVEPPPKPPDGLTPREVEVLELIAEGLSNPEIAQRLSVSAATVKSHINRLLGKIGARDRAQAVSYAYRKGIASL